MSIAMGRHSRIYTSGELAHILGVSPDNVRRYARVGIIVGQRTQSGRFVFSDADLNAAKEYRRRVAG